MIFEELPDIQYPEDSEHECKARLDRDDALGWLKSVAGFANANGGTLFLGVEDKTNKLIGYDRAEADSERNYFNNQVNGHISPRPPYTVSFIRYEICDQERFIIRVNIDSSPVKPVILKYKGIPSIYIRREGFTGGATYEEIIYMSIRSNKGAYETVPSGMNYAPEYFKELKSFYSGHNGGRELTEKALASMFSASHAINGERIWKK